MADPEAPRAHGDVAVAEKSTHNSVDATFDVAKEAIGGNAADLGRGYYRSRNFIGSVAVR